MVADNNHSDERQSHWQRNFMVMMPEIQQRLRCAFRHLDPESLDEAVEEGLVHCLLSFVHLHERGRAEVASPSTLAWYSERQVKRGRPAAGRMNGKDPLSRYAQIGSGIQIERQLGNWIEAIVEDKRAPIPDQVATKMDAAAWFATLSRRMRQIAKDLAFGCSTSEVARRNGVTAGRISQLRRSLEASWAEFQQETVAVA